MNIKHNFKKLISFLAGFLYPPVCPICGERSGSRGEACGECGCRMTLESFEHCPSCGKTAVGCTCPHELDGMISTQIGGVRRLSATFYHPAREREEGRVTEAVIICLKETGDCADTVAETVAESLRGHFCQAGEDISDWIVTYPPRSMKNRRRYGVDHGRAVAKALAARLKIPMADTARRVGGEEQKSLDGNARIINASQTLELIPEAVKAGGKYILFDDIITTGATMAAMDKLLREGGAGEVFPVSFARTLSGYGRGSTDKGEKA